MKSINKRFFKHGPRIRFQSIGLQSKGLVVGGCMESEITSHRLFRIYGNKEGGQITGFKKIIYGSQCDQSRLQFLGEIVGRGGYICHLAKLLDLDNIPTSRFLDFKQWH